MHAFELLLLFIGLVAHVSAQWLRNNKYFPNSPPDFMVGATPEQMEQCKRIITDGNLSVSGSRDTTIRVWDIENGECTGVLYGHVAAVRCVQFDGVRIISGAYGYSVKVWDAETGSCLHTLTGHNNRVYSLLFDSERDIVVSGSLDTTIRVWNIREGMCTQTLIGHESLTSGMQLRGNILVSGNADSTIKVWDITDGQCKYTLSGPNRHASAVTSLQFLENGLVTTSSDDGSVKLWDVKQGTFVRDLVRLRSEAQVVASGVLSLHQQCLYAQ